MEREIDPIKYLPPILQEVEEIQQIYEGITPELKLLFIQYGTMLDESFVLSAESYGLDRMESILQITPQVGDTIENRRLRILTKLNGDTPYTFEKLYEKLKVLCGAENVTMRYSNEKYTLDVRIQLIAKNQFQTVRQMLLDIVPANISLSCLLVYNTYNIVGKYTHAQLKPYTHQNLTEEVLT